MCQVLASGKCNFTDDADARLVNVEDIVMSLQDAMATQQLHYDTELTSLKQELIDVMMTKQQHEAELKLLKDELTNANDNRGLCRPIVVYDTVLIKNT